MTHVNSFLAFDDDMRFELLRAYMQLVCSIEYYDGDEESDESVYARGTDDNCTNFELFGDWPQDASDTTLVVEVAGIEYDDDHGEDRYVELYKTTFRYSAHFDDSTDVYTFADALEELEELNPGFLEKAYAKLKAYSEAA